MGNSDDTGKDTRPDTEIDFSTGGGMDTGLLRRVAREKIDSSIRIGQTVGAWEIDEELGRGGMGVVYRAHRSDGEYEQAVALKVIQLSYDGTDQSGRFLNERQILATLDHPNIARMIDGGTTAANEPFLVMELVEGISLTDYCKKLDLSLDQRLDLFCQVISAVDYAHRQLVVHRDLKPSNILVTEDGEVKLLDFGVTKLIGNENEDVDSTLTMDASAPITLIYASPEMISDEPVRTGSDIYQLGNLLYEMLTGFSPFESCRSNYLELIQAINTRPPLPPSQALDQAIQNGKSVAHNYSMQMLDWPRRIRGDLDAIFSVATRKSAADRYANASSMLDDLEAYRSGRPLSIRRNDQFYRVRKFIRRHVALVSTLTISVLALLASGIYYTQAIRTQRDMAISASETSRQVNQFITNLLESADPDIAQGKELTVREVLEQATYELTYTLDTQPEVKIELLSTIGRTFLSLGEYETACNQLDEANRIAVASNRSVADRAGIMLSLANCQWRQDELTASTDTLDRLASQVDPGSEIMMRIHARRADIALSHGLPDVALASALKASELVTEDTSPQHAIDVLEALGFSYRTLGELDEATTSLSEALAISVEYYGRRHQRTAKSMANLANVYTLSRVLDRSEQLLTEALEIMTANLGPEHPQVADIYMSLGVLGFYKNDFNMAVAAFDKAKNLSILAYGPDSTNVAGIANNLGAAYLELSKHDDAIRELKEAIRIREVLSGDDSINLANPVYNLVNVLKDRDREDEALHYVRKLISLTEANMSSLSPLQAGRNYVISSRIYRDLGALTTSIDYLNLADSSFQKADNVPDDEYLLLLMDLEMQYRKMNDSDMNVTLNTRVREFAAKHELEIDYAHELLMQE